MKLPQINNDYQDEVKNILRKNKILISDFRDYGRVWYDFIENKTHLTLRKYNGIYDYRIAIVDGDIGNHPFIMS